MGGRAREIWDQRFEGLLKRITLCPCFFCRFYHLALHMDFPCWIIPFHFLPSIPSAEPCSKISVCWMGVQWTKWYSLSGYLSTQSCRTLFLKNVPLQEQKNILLGGQMDPMNTCSKGESFLALPFQSPFLCSRHRACTLRRLLGPLLALLNWYCKNGDDTFPKPLYSKQIPDKNNVWPKILNL